MGMAQIDGEELRKNYREFYRNGWWDGFAVGAFPFVAAVLGLAIGWLAGSI